MTGPFNLSIYWRRLIEIAGHKFRGLDGKTIWYDWQFPKGGDFFLAG